MGIPWEINMKILAINEEIGHSAVVYEDDNGEIHIWNPIPPEIKEILDRHKDEAVCYED